MQPNSASEQLGYPEDARLLIINADDFGMCHSINEAVVQAWSNGVVTSTSLMVVCPWAPHALSTLSQNPDLPFGVHLTLTRNPVAYRWGPMAQCSSVASLLDDSGYFFSDDRIPELLDQAKLDEIEVEFRAQIEAVLSYPLSPTHLDWHCLPDGGRDDIFELTLALAREYDLALRIHDRKIAQRLRQEGLPCNDHGLLDSFRYDPSRKSSLLREELRALPPGLSEWALHPSLGNAESQAMEPNQWQVRESDCAFLTDPETRSLIEAEGIILLDYRALQQVWRQKRLMKETSA